MLRADLAQKFYSQILHRKLRHKNKFIGNNTRKKVSKIKACISNLI